MRRFSTGKPFRNVVTGVKPVKSVVDLANRFAEAGDVPKVKELIEPLLSDRANAANEEKNQKRVKDPKPRFLYNLVLKALANIGDLEGAEAWYARMRQKNVVPSERTFGKLVKCGAVAGDPQSAELWLRRSSGPQTGSPSRGAPLELRGSSVSVPQLVSVMDAWARAGDGHRAQAWLQRLQRTTNMDEGSERSERGERGELSDGRDVEMRASRAGKGASAMAWAHLGDLRKTALSTSATLSHQNFDKVQWVALLDACAKSSNASKAVECFQLGLDVHLEPCVVTYTPLIDAFARSKNGQEAEKTVLAMLKRGISLESSSGASLLSSWAKMAEVARIEAWLLRFKVVKVKPDAIVYTNLISACSTVGDVERAESCLEEMERLKMQTNVVTYTAVLQAHLQKPTTLQGPQSAQLFMERMLNFDAPEKRPNALTFGLLIGALASHGDVCAAERWYACMRRNLPVDLVAHNAVISAAAKGHDAQRARLWLDRMSIAQLEPNGMSFNSTLDAMARFAESSEEAKQVEVLHETFYEDPLNPQQQANEISFSILMRPWAQLGDLENVDRLWQKMEQQGIQPQACNLWAVLTACAHAQPPLPDTAAQRYQDWVAAGGTTDRHVISALRAALEGVKTVKGKSRTASRFGEKSEALLQFVKKRGSFGS